MSIVTQFEFDPEIIVRDLHKLCIEVCGRLSNAHASSFGADAIVCRTGPVPIRLQRR